MTQHPDLFTALAASFNPDELKVYSHSGKQIHYVTARTVMNRLDNVLGPENWWDEYEPGEHSVLCRLTIRLPDGQVLTKADAGGYAGMSDSGDDDKSGFSDAFKRAAVKFGVARYLYRDGIPSFAGDAQDAPPAKAPAAPPPAANGHANGHASNGHHKERHDWPGASDPAIAPAHKLKHEPGAPRTGKALFAWVRDAEQRYEVGLLKYINGWAKLQEFPGRMVEWDADQVALAYAETIRKLASLAGDNGHAEGR